MSELLFKAFSKELGLSEPFNLFDIEQDESGRHYISGYGKFWSDTIFSRYIESVDDDNKMIFENDICYVEIDTEVDIFGKGDNKLKLIGVVKMINHCWVIKPFDISEPCIDFMSIYENKYPIKVIDNILKNPNNTFPFICD